MKKVIFSVILLSLVLPVPGLSLVSFIAAGAQASNLAVGTGGGTNPGGTTPGGNFRILIEGPHGEDKDHLPSVQADKDIWYHVVVKGLEPKAGYHLKIYLAEGYSPPSEGRHAEGTESVCAWLYPDGSLGNGSSEAISNDQGEINMNFPDDHLPDRSPTGKEPAIGTYIFEVATGAKTNNPFSDDCVRGDYVGHIQITIVDTPKDYNPSPPEEPVQKPNLVASSSPSTIKVAGDFAKTFISFALGIAGGLAFLLMVFGSYRLIFAGGNPEAIQQGKEIITAAIIGLLVIIFSSFLLNLLGIGIFGLNIGG